MIHTLTRGWFLSVLLLLISPLAFSATPAETKSKQLLGMEAVLVELETHYGMTEFKQQHYGVTTQSLREKYTRLIKGAQTLEEAAGEVPAIRREVLSEAQFEQLLIAMGSEFKDGHLNVSRNTLEYWTLGIYTVNIENRLFVAGFNPEVFSKNSAMKDVQVGDEITHINGQDVFELALRNERYAQSGSWQTRMNHAMESLIEVSYRFFPAKTTGEKVKLTFKRGKESFTGNYRWVNTKGLRELKKMVYDLWPARRIKPADQPYVYGDSSTKSSYFKEGLKKSELAPGTIQETGKYLNLELREQAVQEAEAKAKKVAEAANESAPEIAQKKTPTPVERLEAYTVLHEGKTLGVIRIPDYSPSSYEEVRNEFLWLGAILERFENTTDLLIIDQLSNGGGYVLAVKRLMQLLANKEPIKGSSERLRLSKTYIASQEGDLVAPSGVNSEPPTWGTLQVSKLTFEKMKAAFERGEKFFGPAALDDEMMEQFSGEHADLFPMGKTYSKPVLFLTDSRSGSGGDFAPATLQANKRAVIMGETTMGLGGPVYRGQASMPGSELSMRCTRGLCLRADSLPMENIGVIPDITRNVRPEDLKEGFRSYSKDVLSAALGILKGQTADQIQTEMAESLEKATTASWNADQKAALELAKDLNRDFQASHASLKPSQLEKAYAKYSADLEGLLKEMGDQAYRVVEVVIPAQLLKADLILMASPNLAAAQARLQEMIGMTYPKTLKSLAQVVINGMKPFVGVARKPNCKDLFEVTGFGTQLPVN